jgi:hypothetical protein
MRKAVQEPASLPETSENLVDHRRAISDEELRQEVERLSAKDRLELTLLALMHTCNFDFHYLVELLQRRLIQLVFPIELKAN